MSNRDNAITNMRNLAQQVWEESVSPGNQAYYVERDGRITRDEFIGNFHERQSVYFGEDGHAIRIGDTGCGSVSYNGDEGDYRNAGDVDPAATADMEPGRYIGQEHSLDGKTYVWTPEGWAPLEDDICDFRSRDVDNPSDPFVEAIEAIEVGFFDDETAAQAAA